jgi:hypothetical protein
MEKIINFYSEEKNNLLSGNLSSIERLCSLIESEQENLVNKTTLENSCLLVDELVEIFSLPNYKNANYADFYIGKITRTLNEIINVTKPEILIIKKKLNCYKNFLQYLKYIHNNKKLLLTNEKYELLYDSYIMFGFFDVSDAKVEFYSNDHILYYTKTNEYIKMCIYYLDELYGLKLFLTFRHNLINQKININVYDVLIESERDFYNKLSTPENWKLPYEFAKSNILQNINITSLAGCFSNNDDNITIKFSESAYVDTNKMFEFLIDFLH